MKDREFIRGKVPMTKEPIRIMSIGMLALAGKKKMLDIGGGTGSVAIDAAYQYPDLRVWIIERNQAGIDLIGENARKFQVEDRMEIIHGMAPEDLPDEMYDSIFVGGSGSELEAILEYSMKHLLPGGHIVCNFILMENFMECYELLKKYEDRLEVDVYQMSASAYQPLGKGHYLEGVNPIMIIRGIVREG